MLKRQKQVTVRFTEKEYIQLKNKCDTAGMKMEPFLRALVSGCTIRERPPDNYKDFAGARAVKRLLGLRCQSAKDGVSEHRRYAAADELHAERR